MTLPVSGPIALSQVDVELGASSNAVISLGSSVVRTLAEIPSGGINMGSLHGKASSGGFWIATTNLQSPILHLGTDDEGNLYTLGSHTSGGFTVVKWSKTGNVLWANRYAVDSSYATVGRICFSAQTNEILVLIARGSLLPAQTRTLAVLGKDGSLIRTLKILDSASSDFASATYPYASLAVCSNGNVLVSGTFNASGRFRYYSVLFDPGLNGSLSEVSLAGNPASLTTESFAFQTDSDASNNVFAALTVNSSGNRVELYKLTDGSQTTIWSTRWKHSTLGTSCRGIRVGSNGNLYLLVAYSSALELLCLNSSGTLLWNTNIATGSASDQEYLDVDANDNVYVAHRYYGVSSPLLVLKFNSSGDIQYQRAISHVATTGLLGLVVDTDRVCLAYGARLIKMDSVAPMVGTYDTLVFSDPNLTISKNTSTFATLSTAATVASGLSTLSFEVPAYAKVDPPPAYTPTLVTM